MTLAVTSFGEGDKKSYLLLNSVVYLLTASLSGAAFGYFLIFSIMIVSPWIETTVKLYLLISLIIVYLLKDLWGIIIPTPQRKWQIPTSWVNHHPLVNMGIWGIILGAGVFTYNPHAIFLIIYLYVGFFLAPEIGLLIGGLYGITRAFSSIYIGFSYHLFNKNQDLLITDIWSKSGIFRKLHINALLGLLILVCFQYILA
ncbi:MAG: hypothetical protein LRY73_19500 [Bacillus sp. (in: Bacteria)]|nr:hypothetical protein [Bacillus sp. (in: firmicutes)]